MSNSIKSYQFGNMKITSHVVDQFISRIDASLGDRRSVARKIAADIKSVELPEPTETTQKVDCRNVKYVVHVFPNRVKVITCYR